MFSHAKIPAAGLKIAALAAAAFGTYLVYSLATRGVRGTAAAITESAVDAAGDVVTGAVIGAGRAVGIPDTDAVRCYEALRDRRLWDASKFCPAPTFAKGIFGVMPPTPDGLSGPDGEAPIWPLFAIAAIVMLPKARHG